MIITKKDIIQIIKEELEHVLEVVPRTGIYAVHQSDIDNAKRIEKMYRDAGLTERADVFKDAIEKALAYEINIEQFNNMLDSVRTLYPASPRSEV